MKKVVVTQEAFNATRGEAKHEFNTSTSTQLSNGSWEIQLSEEVFDYLNSMRSGSETISDVIVRLIATRKGTH